MTESHSGVMTPFVTREGTIQDGAQREVPPVARAPGADAVRARSVRKLSRPNDWIRHRPSSRSVVVAQEPAETLTTADITCLHRRLAVHQLVADPLMIPLAVVVDHELVDRVSEVTLPNGITRCKPSSLIDRTNRSACALACAVDCTASE